MRRGILAADVSWRARAVFCFPWRPALFLGIPRRLIVYKVRTARLSGREERARAGQGHADGGKGDRGAAPGTDSGGGGRATRKGGGVYPAGATAESCAPVHVVPSFSQNADVPTELRAATRT